MFTEEMLDIVFEYNEAIKLAYNLGKSSNVGDKDIVRKHYLAAYQG